RPQLARLAVHLHRHLVFMQLENACLGGSIWEYDVIARVLPEAVGPLMQPEQAGDRQPAAVALQRILALTPPLGNLRLVMGSREQRQPGQRSERKSPGTHSPDQQRAPAASMSCSSITANSSDCRS